MRDLVTRNQELTQLRNIINTHSCSCIQGKCKCYVNKSKCNVNLCNLHVLFLNNCNNNYYCFKNSTKSKFSTHVQQNFIRSSYRSSLVWSRKWYPTVICLLCVQYIQQPLMLHGGQFGIVHNFTARVHVDRDRFYLGTLVFLLLFFLVLSPELFQRLPPS